MATYLAVAAVVGLLALMLGGVLSDRVRVRSCCGTDPTHDLRMRPAFADPEPTPTQPTRSKTQK